MGLWCSIRRLRRMTGITIHEVQFANVAVDVFHKGENSEFWTVTLSVKGTTLNLFFERDSEIVQFCQSLMEQTTETGRTAEKDSGSV